MSESILGGFMTVGETYILINRADPGRALNVWSNSTYPAANLSNVCLWTKDTNDTAQHWKLVKSGGHYLLKPVDNENVALDLYTGSGSGANCNAHLYTPSQTSWLTFELAADDRHIKIRLENTSKYLTANPNQNGTRTGTTSSAAGNVYFWQGGLTDGKQEWTPRRVGGGSGGTDYNLGNGSIAVGQRPGTFDVNHSAYSAAFNRFHGNRTGYYAQCTWYCYGRAYEVLGKTITFSQTSGLNGGTWYALITNGVKTQIPTANSIAVWDDGGAGHVAYVERVSGNNIYISEANWGGISNTFDPEDGKVKVLSWEPDGVNYAFKVRNGGTHTFVGFVKLT